MTAPVFNYASWIALYPEFVSVAEPQATMYAAIAEQLIGRVLNDPCASDATLSLYLNVATAHVVKLNVTIGGVAPSGLVGRITDASEGSVSVKVDYGAQSASSAYWLQTPYGALLWQLIAGYLTGFYEPGPQRFAEPFDQPMTGGIWMGAGTGRGQW